MRRQLEGGEEGVEWEWFADVSEGCNCFRCIICIGAGVHGGTGDASSGGEGRMKDLAYTFKGGLVEFILLETTFDEVRERLRSMLVLIWREGQKG